MNGSPDDPQVDGAADLERWIREAFERGSARSASDDPDGRARAIRAALERLRRDGRLDAVDGVFSSASGEVSFVQVKRFFSPVRMAASTAMTIGAAGSLTPDVRQAHATLSAASVMSVSATVTAPPSSRQARRALSPDKRTAVTLLSAFVVLYLLVKIAAMQANLSPHAQIEVNDFLTDLELVMGGIALWLGFKALKK